MEETVTKKRKEGRRFTNDGIDKTKGMDMVLQDEFFALRSLILELRQELVDNPPWKELCEQLKDSREVDRVHSNI